MAQIKEEPGMWFSRKELAGKPGMPSHERDVRKLEKAEKWESNFFPCNGGHIKKIRITSLPAETRFALAHERAKALTPPQPELPELSLLEVANKLPEIPEYNRKPYYRILHSLEMTDGLKGREMMKFIEEYNKRNPESPLLSYPSIMRAKDTIRDHGYMALVGKYGNRKGDTTVKAEWGEYFWLLYGNQNKLSFTRCHRETIGHFCTSKVDMESFPSKKAFATYLLNNYGTSVIYYAREGDKKWTNKYGRDILRDYSSLVAGECWVGDHAQIDVGVDSGGKMVFMWLTSWVDMKTSKMLGWVLHEEPPNSDHIFEAFYIAASTYGIPQYIYIDNGKDYRCKDFAGGRESKRKIDEIRITPLLKSLGIIVIFSLPYNPQSKIVERIHLKIKDLFSRSCVGFRGGKPDERPEKLKDEINKGLLMKPEEIKEAFADFALNILNKMPDEGNKLKGKSPDEAWNNENPTLRKVRPESLIVLCSRSTSPRTVRKNGIEDSKNNVIYYAEWMAGALGQKVYVRRLRNNLDEAWCFDEDEQYVGKATVYQRVDAIVKTDEGQQALSAAMQEKRSAKNAVREKAKPTRIITKGEHFNNLRAVSALASPTGTEEAPAARQVTVLTHTDKAIEQERKDARQYIGERPTELWKLQVRRERAFKELSEWDNYYPENHWQGEKQAAARDRLNKEIDEIDAKIAACRQAMTDTNDEGKNLGGKAYGRCEA